jgi:pyruvate kinase
MDLEKVPAIQKTIIERCRYFGRFVITATQMLESMIENPLPTRAEVSDVANAIYDGSSAVMLSAETSTGKHPIEAVKMMAKIAVETESAVRREGFKPVSIAANPTIPQIIADAAFHVARSAEVSAIAVGTSSGKSARLLSRYRPPVPIFAFTANESVARRLSVICGVEAIISPASESTDKMLQQMERLLLATGHVKVGDHVVFVAGQPVNQSGTTNILNLHCISEPL